MKRLVLLAVLIIGAATAAQADFATGLRSYEAGDYYAAYKEWLPLAESGDPAAQRNLGHLYRLGRGVTKDFVKAAAWYRKSAEQGFARAQANLGNMYLRGQGVPKDPLSAAKWFGRAAKQEHSIAQFNLGLMYENGIGLAQDDVAALGWYYRASKAGHRKAAQRLARLVSRGATPPTDNTLAPTEPDKRDRLASAQRGKPAQPLYGESGAAGAGDANSDKADSGGVNSGDVNSGDIGPDKVADERSDADSPKLPSPTAPHPVIVAEAREDAARAKENAPVTDAPPNPTVPEADKSDQPADPPVEPVIAPVQARDEAEPAKPVPPHPIIVAEAAAAIQEDEASSAEGEPKEIADTRKAAISEESVPATGDAAKSKTANSDAVPPPAFLVREAEQQQIPKEESVAVEPAIETASLPEEKTEPPDAHASAQPAISSAKDLQPASKKSTVRQKAIELAALRQAARRAARFEQRLQSQLPDWASEFKNVPTSSAADTSIEKTKDSKTPKPATAPAAPSPPQEIVATDAADAPDHVSPKSADSASSSASPASPPGQPEAGVASNTEPDTDSTTARDSDAKADAVRQTEADPTRSNRSEASGSQEVSSLSSALASAVADLTEPRADKDDAATEAATKATKMDGSSSKSPPTDQKMAAANGVPPTQDPDEVAASTGARPSAAPETAAVAEVPAAGTEVPAAGTEVPAASVPAESDGAADGDVAVSQPQNDGVAAVANGEGLPAGTASSDLTAESTPDATTLEAGIASSGAPERVASLADEQASASTATNGDTIKPPSEPIPAVPDDAVKQVRSGKQVRSEDSERVAEENAPATFLLPEITPAPQTEDSRVEPLSAETDKPAPPAPHHPTNTENVETRQTAIREIVSKRDESTQTPEASGDGQAVEQVQAPSSASTVQEANSVSDRDPASRTKPASAPDTPVQVAAVSAAVAKPPEAETAIPQDRGGIVPAEASGSPEATTGSPAPAESPPTTPNQPNPAPNATPAAAPPQETAMVPAATPKQSTGDLLEQERRRLERERIAEQRQTTREEQARRRIRKLLKIQKSWELATLRRNRATNTEIIRDGGGTSGRLPAGKSKSDDPASAPPQKSSKESVTTAPAAVPDGESNSATDQPATEKPDIDLETSSPRAPLGESETSSPAPPLGVALDAGMSAYQAYDYEAAFRHWLPPAENGNSNAQFFVEGLYRDGAGVPEDPVRAFHWWTLAAGQGHRQADKLLAELESEMLPEEIAAAKKLSE